MQVKTPRDLKKIHTNYMTGLSISISTPAVCVSIKSLIDSRLPIELGPWQLNTGCESPLEHRTGYWMRHIKPLFMRNIIGCSAFRPYWILMDLVMFCLTHSLLVILFTKLFKTRLEDQFKQERRSKLLSSSRFDTLKCFIEDDRQESYIYKIRTCIRNFLYSIENRHERFINMPYHQNNCACLPAVFQRTGVCFALCFEMSCVW